MSAPPAPSVLQDLLAVEHLAVFGYGLVGGRTTDAAQAYARECEAAHRGRRDALVAALTELGAEPVAGEAAYAVAEERDALALAVALEEQVAAAAVTAVGATTDPADRRTAAATAAEAAVRAARWRTAGGTVPATQPFPGRG